ncbi:glycosyltransferase [Amycolatopsis carbonis]|uniref:Glycosyltransferase n=1 Tax=Amycolatopsis carbonis TaxID=715471 RepID=A0A9Y2I7B4_9PSEU|nr:glycosyltransferase [Amycolatopsis sp. 2-15]WIX75140.1 glycosyltransferase [Amycolatopsis sp. 2-15]
MITFGFLSTYPPTLCGLASFTASLRAALPPGSAGGVVRAVESRDSAGAPEVVGDLVAGSPRSWQDAATLLDREDVAIVQHEYGIYGGEDDEDVLRVLELLRVPAIVVLHTVLTAPTPHQREVLNGVLAAATAIVVMSEAARTRLVAGYDVPAGRLTVIPHGATDTNGTAPVPVPHRTQQRQILTWGLLGPGKGIEWGIDAMALLPALWPEPRYLVAGRTHPKVLAQQGESYRHSLLVRTERLGVGDRVRFDSRYLDTVLLRRLVARAEVVLLPYDSRDQVTSGVLIEAVTARTPVVATRFPHAVELLSGGAGTLVNHQDPAAIAAALQTILTDRDIATRMAGAAGIVARTLGWTSVAKQYDKLGAELVSAAAPVVA